MTDCLLNPKPNSKQMGITDAWYIRTVSSSLAWSWHALLLNTSLIWLPELIKPIFLPFSSMFETIDFILVCYETAWPRKSDMSVILLSFPLIVITILDWFNFWLCVIILHTAQIWLLYKQEGNKSCMYNKQHSLKLNETSLIESKETYKQSPPRQTGTL